MKIEFNNTNNLNGTQRYSHIIRVIWTRVNRKKNLLPPGNSVSTRICNGSNVTSTCVVSKDCALLFSMNSGIILRGGRIGILHTISAIRLFSRLVYFCQEILNLSNSLRGLIKVRRKRCSISGTIHDAFVLIHESQNLETITISVRVQSSKLVRYCSNRNIIFRIW